MKLNEYPLLLCSLVLMASQAMGQSAHKTGLSDPLKWRTYTVKGEQFEVALPTLPAMKTERKFNQRLGKPRLEMRLNTSLEGVTYNIDVFHNLAPPQSLEEFIAEANSEYDLTTARDLNVDGVAGKEYSSQDKSSPSTRQFFVTQWGLYRFTVTGSSPDHFGVKRFFSSIRFGRHVGGIAVSDGDGNPLEVAGERLVTGWEVDSKLKLLSKPEPQYTEDARRERIGGTVVLKAIFSSTGEVTNIRVISGLPYGLTEQAIAAAKRIRFTPAMKNGKPVSMWIQLEYYFNP